MWSSSTSSTRVEVEDRLTIIIFFHSQRVGEAQFQLFSSEERRDKTLFSEPFKHSVIRANRLVSELLRNSWNCALQPLCPLVGPCSTSNGQRYGSARNNAPPTWCESINEFMGLLYTGLRYQNRKFWDSVGVRRAFGKGFGSLNSKFEIQNLTFFPAEFTTSSSGVPVPRGTTLFSTPSMAVPCLRVWTKNWRHDECRVYIDLRKLNLTGKELVLI